MIYFLPETDPGEMKDVSATTMRRSATGGMSGSQLSPPKSGCSRLLFVAGKRVTGGKQGSSAVKIKTGPPNSSVAVVVNAS